MNRQHHGLGKRLFAFLMALALLLPAFVWETRQPAKAAPADPFAGRINVETLPRGPQGWGSAPTTENYQELGYEKEGGRQMYGNNPAYLFVRKTEVVPQGEVPIVKGVTRYIMDDGTFVDPTYAPKMIAPTRDFPVFAQNLPVPAYTFDDESLRETYLPHNGHANIAVFYGKDDRDNPAFKDMSGQFFWCINPNSIDPNYSPNYVLEPTRYNPQTNYRTLNELSYIMDGLMRYAGLHDNFTPDAAEPTPDFVRGFNSLCETYNEISSGVDGSKTSLLDPRLTNGEVKKYLDFIWPASEDLAGKVVDGEVIPFQTDRNNKAFHYLAPLKKDQDNIVALGVEYTFNHYAQGFPIGGVDHFIGESGFWGGEIEARTIYARCFARIIFAYTEAAREKGLLDDQPATGITAELLNRDFRDGKYYLDVKLGFDPSTLPLSTTGPRTVMAFIDPSMEGKIVLKGKANPQDPSKDLIIEPLAAGFYAINVDELQKVGNILKIEADQSVEPSGKVMFFKDSETYLMGSVWVGRETFAKDEETGRWLIKEYRLYNPYFPTSTPAGMTKGQSLMFFNPHRDIIRSTFEFKLWRGEAKTLATALKSDKVVSQAEETTADDGTTVKHPAEVRPGTYSLRDVVLTGGLDKVDTVFEGTLRDAADPTKVVAGPVRVRATEEQMNSGKINVDFGEVNLEKDKTYVFYQTIAPATEWDNLDGAPSTWSLKDLTSSKIVRLHDAKDPLEMIRVADKPTMKTTVTVDGIAATDKAAAAVTVYGDETTATLPISDLIAYSNFDPQTQYVFYTQLMKNVTGSKPVAVGEPVITKATTPAADSSDKREVTVSLGNVNVEIGAEYVIYEAAARLSDCGSPTSDKPTLPKDEKLVIRHEDPNDKSQSFKVEKASIGTTVKIGESASSAQTAVEVAPGIYDVTDTIGYENLEPKAEYVAKGVLMDKEAKAAVGDPVYVKFTAAESGTGTQDVVFTGVKLESGKTYVAFETVGKLDQWTDNKDGTYAEKTDGEYLKHHSYDDKAQTVVAKTWSIGTTVKVNGNASTAQTAVEVAPGVYDVTDTIAYENLKPKAEYVAKGVLMDKQAKTEVGTPAYAKFTTSETGSGTTDVVFEGMTLDPGKTYVVFETVGELSQWTDNGDKTYTEKEGAQTVSHKDYEDKAQTVISKEGPFIGTTVKVDGKASTDQTAVEVAPGVYDVTDTIGYENLDAKAEYVAKGVLMDKEAQTPVGDPVYVKFTADQSGNGTQDVVFKGVKLESGKTYVAFETVGKLDQWTDNKDGTYAEKTDGKYLTHHSYDDKAQTVVTKTWSIGTTVKVNGNASTAQTAVEVAPGVYDVTDTIAYENLKPKAEYVAKGVLMNKEAEAEASTPVYARFTTSETGTGTTDVVFKGASLDPGKTYVVFETVGELSQWKDNGDKTYTEKEGAQTVSHKSYEDKAQTVVTKDGKLGTTVTVDKASSTKEKAVQVAPGTYDVTDTISYENLKGSTSYIAQAELWNATDDVSTGVVVFHRFTTEATGAGTTDVPFANVKLSDGKSYVVLETVSEAGNWTDKGQNVYELKEGAKTYEHKDKGDLAQTVVTTTRSIKTTVKIDGVGASSASTALEVAPGVYDVTDTITYENLQPGKTYVAEGVLMDKATEAPAGPVAYAEFVASNTGNGTADVVFKNVTLSAGTTYVVFETVGRDDQWVKSGATYSLKSENPDVVTHKDLADTAQTLVTTKPAEKNPSIKTTVAVGTESSSAEAAVIVKGGKHLVKDTITYTDLDAGEYYVAMGELMDQSTGAATGHVGYAKFTANADGNGTAEVSFGEIELEAGKTYVVFETVAKLDQWKDNGDGTYTLNKDAKTIVHKELNDAAQTVVVEKPVEKNPVIGTTVSVEGKGSSSAQAALILEGGTHNVTDMIGYEDLDDGEYYVAMGELVDQSNGQSTGYVAFAKFSADATGNGTVAVPFGDIELEAGKTYVVFETVAKLDQWTEKTDGTYALKQGAKTIEHKRLDDLAQTLVVKKPEKPEPNEPAIGTTVAIGDSSATAREALKVQAGLYDMTDTVSYTGLEGGKEYVVQGTLMDQTTQASTGYVAWTKFTADASGNGTVKVEFKGVALEPDKTYVVFETASLLENWTEKDGGYELNAGAKTVDHKDLYDPAQTVVTEKPEPEPKNPWIGTTVQIGDMSATAETALEVAPGTYDVTDTVSYNDFEGGKEYVVEGRLVDVESGKETGHVAWTTFIADATGSGTVDVVFKGVSLEAGKSYVVFERAQRIEKWTKNQDGSYTLKPGETPYSHEDPRDPAQTIVVQKPEPKNPSIGTTVQIGDMSANAQSALQVAPGVYDITDVVSYNDFEGGKEYVVEGRLIDRESGKETGHIAWTTFIADASGNGSVNVVFKGVKLDPEKAYVVFERAQLIEKWTKNPDGGYSLKPGEKPYSHEDPKDPAQTVVVEKKKNPELRTTVSVLGKSASAQSAAEVAPGVYDVTDTVTYKDLEGGKHYVVEGRLVDQATGEDTGYIAWQEFVADPSGNGTIEVAFFGVTLEDGKGYVVFERAAKAELWTTHPDGTKSLSPDAKPVSHEDLKDKAQTVVVKKPQEEKPWIGTTVSIGTLKSSSERAIEVEPGVYDVIDTVQYHGLKPGKTYIAMGRLIDQKTLKDTGIVAWREFTASATGNGSVDVLFKGAKLSAGTTYVAYEVVSERENWNDTPGGGHSLKPNAPSLKHENPKDKSQTVVVKKPTPEKPTPKKPTPKRPNRPPSPTTGDPILATYALMGAASAAYVAMRKKNKR